MDIKVPPLGESVTEATVGRWHKAVGETVALDDILVELETDKITLEVNATEAGRREQGDRLMEELDALFLEQPASYWIELFERGDVPATLCITPRQADGTASF